MLQNIVFQDNLYQFNRIITATADGLMLNLSDDIFYEKTLDDVLFFDMALEKFFMQIEQQTHLPDYISIMRCLYFSTTKYLSMLTKIIQKQVETPTYYENHNIKEIHNKHSDFLAKISAHVQESDKNIDSYQIVSQNELSELLNF